MIDIVQELKQLRFDVWLKDIPSPTCPEYEEHHKAIMDILMELDALTDKVEKELALALGAKEG